MVKASATKFTAWIGLLASLLSFTAAASNSITVAWQPSQAPTAIGYLLLYGTDGTNFGNVIDTGTNTSTSVSGLQVGTSYYFEVEAYDVHTNLSAPSTPMMFAIPGTNWQIALNASPATAGTLAGGGKYLDGSSVTVTASAEPGYAFAGWTLNGSVLSTNSSYTFDASTNATLTANFYPVTYILTPSAGTGGTISPNTPQTVGAGSVTFTATPQAGYQVNQWLVNGATAQVGGLTYTAANLQSNETVSVTFTTDPLVRVEAGSSGGSVSGGGSYPAGSSATVKATPSAGYSFVNWTSSGVPQSTAATYTFTVAGDCTLTANFTAITYTVNPSAGANGGILPAAAQNVTQGSNISFTAQPATGYHVNQWLLNGLPVQTGSSAYTLDNVQANEAVSVTFAANPVISVAANSSTAGTVSGGGTYAVGAFATVTAAPAANYFFVNWTLNGIVQSGASNYTFVVTTNWSLVANFNPITYSVTSSAGNNGSVTPSGTQMVMQSSNVTFTAQAATGYQVNQWWLNGAVVRSGGASYTLANIQANSSVSVTFTSDPVVSIAPDSDAAGMVSGGGSYPVGATATVSAVAHTNYTFASWTLDGEVQSTNADYAFTVTTNCALIANFTAIAYTVIPSTGLNGTISPATVQTVAAGGTLTFNAQPAPGYQISQWLVNGTAAASAGLAYTLTNVETNTTVSATFSAIVSTSTNTNSAPPPTTPTNTNPTRISANSNFALVTSGSGTVTPHTPAAGFQNGRKYTAVAVPGKGWLFSNWESNSVTISTVSKYSFVAESNLTVEAVFVPNPFASVAGAYHGLFYDTNQPGEADSGAVQAAVTANGAYSAKIRLANGGYSFSGKFDLSGAATATISRPGLDPITVTLQLDFSGGPITGAVTDGSWTAEFQAGRAVYSAANHSPQAGRYTLLIPGVDNVATQPGGNGVGAVNVDSSGNVTFSGVLGDGAAVTSASVVDGQGQWPLFISVYGGKGSVVGWLTFTNGAALGGQVAWFKLAQPAAKLYPAGFTNTTDAIGSAYHHLLDVSPLGMGGDQIVLTGAGLAQPITADTGFASASASAKTGPKLTFNNATGTFTGSVPNPQTGKAVPFTGVVLQNFNYGAGLFTQGAATGSVLLSQAQ